MRLHAAQFLQCYYRKKGERRKHQLELRGDRVTEKKSSKYLGNECFINARDKPFFLILVVV